MPEDQDGRDDAPQVTLAEAEEALRQDGRFGWLLDDVRQAWAVNDVASAYAAASEVPVSHDTVTRWFKRLPAGGADNYGGSIGWRAQRNALTVFFASGGHLRKSGRDGADGEQVG